MRHQWTNGARRGPGWIVPALAAALIAGMAQASPEGPREVPDLEVLAGGIWQAGPVFVSGQPTEETIRALADRGVRAVISLRTAREMADKKAVPFDEAALVRSLGMEYVHIGLGPSGTYSPDALERIHKAIERHGGNVLMHCTVGGRASIAWTALQARYGGMTLQDAVAQGQEMGLWRQQIEMMLGERIEWRMTGEPAEPVKGWLVDAEWLRENGKDRSVRILDVRPNYGDYFKDHAAGAVHFDAHALRGPRDGLPAQFRTNERMAEIFALAGVSPSNRVVVYADGGDILSATMAMFALEKLGHLNTSLLDGGVTVAREAGLVTQDYPEVESAEFGPFENPLCSATLEDVEAAMAGGGVLFVDARPPEQYAGTTNVWKRNGHIPGAANVFWKRLLDENDANRLRSREELRSIFESAGATPDRDIVVYCGTGREASLLYMALTRELGYGNVRLFEGGWTQYAMEERLPVEN